MTEETKLQHLNAFYTPSYISISRLTYNIPERDLELQVFQNASYTGIQSVRYGV